MKNKPAKLFWPELPRGRADIDHVHELLLAWAEWAELGRDEADRHNVTFLYSVVHSIECALILWLAPHAAKRGFDSEIFKDSNELAHALTSGVFALGVPREMGDALITCYSLEQPWELLPKYAKQYAEELTRQLKDIALYDLDASDFWRHRIAQLEREKASLGASLDKVHYGPQQRQDAKDKAVFITWVQEKNIIATSIPCLLEEHKSCWPLENNYSDETIKKWYKEAMPNVELKGGRPKKSQKKGM